MRIQLFCLLTAIALLTGCQSTAEKVTITGSSTVAPVMAAIAERFEASQAELRVDVQSGGSSRGVSDVRKGLADIGMISRDLRDEEADLRAIPIAADGIALIVHQSNAIQNIQADQVRAIYTGAVRNWSELGGADKPIVVIHKDSGHATRDVFLKHFNLQAESVQANVVIGENAEGIKTVASNPNAIGYVSIGAAEKEHELGVPIALVPLDGVAATTANLKNGSYPAKRQLHLVVMKEKALPPLVKELLRYTTGSQVHDLIEGKQYVPLRR